MSRLPFVSWTGSVPGRRLLASEAKTMCPKSVTAGKSEAPLGSGPPRGRTFTRPPKGVPSVKGLVKKRSSVGLPAPNARSVASCYEGPAPNRNRLELQGHQRHERNPQGITSPRKTIVAVIRHPRVMARPSGILSARDSKLTQRVPTSENVYPRQNWRVSRTKKRVPRTKKRRVGR